MSVFIFGMAWQPCTDKVVDRHEHAHILVDPANTTGESPFHEDTCPIFCACTCCATLTVTQESSQLVFRFFVELNSERVQLLVPQEKRIAFVWWHPPRSIV
ncbi:hypothetical protein [Pontibacter burrus]|nr:hypothetical protein [Pontibacter burrus]